MNSRWFKEDRAAKATDKDIEETEKALKASTLLVTRLTRILEEDLEATYKVVEDFENPAWQKLTIAAAAERKTLRRIIKLLP